MLAAPFRAHVRRVLDQTGLPWPVIAGAGNLPPTLIRNLLFGRDGRHRTRLPATAARALLALDAERLLGQSRIWVPAEPAAVVITELLAAGCSPAALARYCRLSESELIGLLDAALCSRLTELLAQAARLQWHRSLQSVPGSPATTRPRRAAGVEVPAQASA
ncbi:hypothetical protein ATK74_2147 [Propionicimonas paludicola]|uniref:Uncharacterized protein n=1 Tax=Propionicimonas paludicola TaxID=185243 RepID=A0A2A9CT18_9ACTN|nr:hypothetical protein ATK74_2147 [Propionicimonas paludicola]